jgi:NADH-quinone oxidoreductase subunit L
MEHLPTIYGAAVLLPLASFLVILLFARQLGRSASVIATGAILLAAICSFGALALWLNEHFPAVGHHAAHEEEQHERQAPLHGKSAGRRSTEYLVLSTQYRGVAGDPSAPAPQERQVHYVSSLQEPEAAPTAAHGEAAAEHAEAHADHGHGEGKPAITGEYYTLAKAGPLRITISYYIDALTVLMFCMVTFIATCIHFYASGYMADELTEVNDRKLYWPIAIPCIGRAAIRGFSSTSRCFASACWAWCWRATSRWCSSSGNWSASARIF